MRGLKTKNDYFLWEFMRMLPFLVFFVSWYRIGGAPSFLTFVDQEFAFPFIRDILNSVWSTAFGADLHLAGYISYLVCVDVVRCFFNVIVFIPRVAQIFIDKFVSFAGGGRN